MLDKIRENTFCNHYMYIVCPLIFQYVSNVDYMINQWFILVRKTMRNVELKVNEVAKR